MRFKTVRIIGTLVTSAALVASVTSSVDVGPKTTVEGSKNSSVRISDRYTVAEDANKLDFFEYKLFAGTGGKAEILQITQNELLFRSGSDLILLDQKDGTIKWRFHDPNRYFRHMRDRVAVFRHEDWLYCIDVDTRRLVSKLSDTHPNVDETTTGFGEEYWQEYGFSYESIGDRSRCLDRPPAFARVDWMMHYSDSFPGARNVEGRSWIAISRTADREVASQLSGVRIVLRYPRDLSHVYQATIISSLARYNGVFYLGTTDGSLIAFYPNADSIKRIESAKNTNTRTEASYIEIDFEVPYASISMDGDMLGQNPSIVGPLWEGFYRISASCSGFSDAELNIFLNYNESQYVTAPLELSPHHAAHFGTAPTPIDFDPDVIMMDNRVLVMIANNGIRVIDPTTLTNLWAERTPARPKVLLIADSIIMAYDENIEVRDIHRGTVDRSIKLEKQLAQIQNFGIVLVYTFVDGTSVAFDLANGEELWRKYKSGRGVLARGLYVQTNGSGDVVSAFEAQSGRLRWRTRASGVGIAVGENTAAIYTYNGENEFLRAFDASDGTLMWQEGRVQLAPNITQQKIAYYRTLKIGNQTICFLANRNNQGVHGDTVEFVVAPNHSVDLSHYISDGYVITSSVSEWYLYRPETADGPLAMFDSYKNSYAVGQNTILIAEDKMLHFFDRRTMTVSRTLRCDSPVKDIRFEGDKFYVLTEVALLRIDSS